MYYRLLTASFVVAVAILVYRNRGFFLSFVPDAIASRLPAALQASASTAPGLPFHTPSSGVFGRWFGSRRYTAVPGFDWSANAANGLSSTLFDISANLEDDARSGLDPSGAQDVQTIMQTQGVSFDQARLIRHKQILVQNNIDPNTGLPLDSKAVTSLGGRIPGPSRGLR